MDPILITIAGALLKEAAKPAVTALVKFVKGKFAKDDPSAELILSAGKENPEQYTEMLAKVLQRNEQIDPEFKRELRTLWERAAVEINASRTEQTASGDGVNNQISGTVHGSVVQARDITGGINLR